jgi:hypothetical protein
MAQTWQTLQTEDIADGLLFPFTVTAAEMTSVSKAEINAYLDRRDFPYRNSLLRFMYPNATPGEGFDQLVVDPDEPDVDDMDDLYTDADYKGSVRFLTPGISQADLNFWQGRAASHPVDQNLLQGFQERTDSQTVADPPIAPVVQDLLHEMSDSRSVTGSPIVQGTSQVYPDSPLVVHHEEMPQINVAFDPAFNWPAYATLCQTLFTYECKMRKTRIELGKSFVLLEDETA